MMTPTHGALRVLVIEDNPPEAELLVRRLQQGGYNLTWERVEDPAGLRAALAQVTWSIVLSDYSMPELDGLTALRLVRAQDPELPFILVSGAVGEEVAVAAIRAGANDYVMKDRPERLVAAVQRELQQAAERRQRRQAQQALHESEELFRSLSQSSPLGIFTATIAGRCTYANPRFRELLALSLPEALQSGWQQQVHPADRLLLDRVWRERAAAGQECSLELRVQLPAGLERWVHLRCAPLRHEQDDRLAGYVGTLEDITERKEAQRSLLETNCELARTLEQLQQAQAQLLQQERLSALGQMASGIAHDFNNSLSAILGLSDLLLSRPGKLQDQSAVRQCLQTIHTAAQDAGQVVHRLREFYRPRAADDVFLPVDLNAVAEQAINISGPRWREQTQANGIEIKLVRQLRADRPMLGSQAELREALLNLIFNAVDAMPQGGQLTVSTDSRDGAVLLAVADTGQGMSAEVRQRCLEPFFSTKGSRGTGLGLSMVHGIVQRHEGRLEIASVVGQGSCFTLHFPAATSAARTIAPSDRCAVPALRVLLVEDEARLRGLYAELLVGDGHRVQTAASGAEALAQFQAAAVDLVITDRAMPGMSGDQLAVALKQQAPDLPVLLVTGFGQISPPANQPPSGVDQVLCKPVTLEQLRQAMALVCRPQEKPNHENPDCR